MRKSNIMFLCDTIFWYLIYFLPVILYGIYLIHSGESVSIINFRTFVESTLLISVVTSANPIYTTLSSLFGSSGIVPLFAGNYSFVLIIITYFASMVIIHLCVDFLLFVPRLCHKWMDMYTKGVEK